MKVEDIPIGQRENVADYLITALNYQSVQPSLACQLDVLLQELKKKA